MDLALRDEPVGDGTRRIALHLLDAALARLAVTEAATTADLEAAVHDVRKRCKEVRAVLRLVRPALGDDRYRNQNVCVRDAARLLSPLRDAHALLATFDALLAADAHRAPAPLGAVRAELRRRAMAATASVRVDDPRLSGARDLLGHARQDIAAWSIPDDRVVLLDGLARVHGQGMDALAAARQDGGAHDFHDWRKRVKYLWYHLQVLDRVAPDLLGPLADTLKALSDALGDAHDLVVLVDEVGAAPTSFGGETSLASLRVVADRRRRDLERRAVNVGARLFAEPTDAFVARLEAYWAAADEVGAPLAVGGIDDVAQVGDDLAGASTAELATRARRLEIAGRSTMSRQELVAAVRAATTR